MLPIRRAQHVVLPSARHDVALIGLDGFEALEQEQPNLKAYRDPASLLVSENFGLDGYRAKNRSHDQIQVMGKTGNRFWLMSLELYRTDGPNLFEISVVSLTPTCESREICETSTCTVSL